MLTAMKTSLEDDPASSRKSSASRETYFDSSLPCIMTAREINSIALEHGGYNTPALNDKLYLHYKGYRKIENLEEYKNLVAIWLDSNGFQKIENLNHLGSLRCLYMSRNLFTRIENLDKLANLVQLDLSENRISHVEGLSMLPKLDSLNLAKNALSSSESISHLMQCKALTTLDLSNNQLSGEDVLKVLSGIQSLLSLKLAGNPITNEVSSFRKKIIVAMKKLRYLDRPVFDMERATSEAWALGGREAELKTRERLKAEQKKEERKAMDDFRSWQQTTREKATDDKRRIIENGPTLEQRTDIEIRNKAIAERKEAAAKEAAKEREIYRIEVKDGPVAGATKVASDCPKPVSPEETNKVALKDSTTNIDEQNNFKASKRVEDHSSPEDSSSLKPPLVTAVCDQHHSSSLLPTRNKATLEEAGATLIKKNITDASEERGRIERANCKSTDMNLLFHGEISDKTPLFKSEVEMKDEITKIPPSEQSFSNTSSLTPANMESKENNSHSVTAGLDERPRLSLLSDQIEVDNNESLDAVESRTEPPVSTCSVSWTKKMDDCLFKFVHQSNYDYSKAAQLMAYNFNVDSKYFTLESCRQRWYLIDSMKRDLTNRDDFDPLKKYRCSTKNQKRPALAGKCSARPK